MTIPSRLRRLLFATTACAGLSAATAAASQAQEFQMRGQDGKSVHAIVVGIDAYQKVRPLKGAVADARDIEGALKKMGVTDVTTLIDADADRNSILRAIDDVTTRIKQGDVVVFSLAGHGAQEPEKVKGSQPDGMDDIFLLPGFDLSPQGSQQRIVGREFNYFIKQFESKGARVIFVADTCHGGGLTREVDPRGGELSYRQVARYVLTVDELKPVGTVADARLTELDFEQTAFLAAVDRQTKAPEIRIPGISGFRGALSYAVARAFEGQADTNNDRNVTLQELFGQVRSVVYQLSDQRQNPVTVASPNRKLDSDIVFTLAPKSVPAAAPVVVSASPSVIIEDAAPAPGPLNVVRLASLDAKSMPLSGLERREVPFEVLNTTDGADIVFDPKSGDVISQGDVIAYGVDKNDLPSVVDRSAAVLGIKGLASKSPQAIKVSPDDKLHRNSSKVVVDILDVAKRALILFNIAGDGTVQLLYPTAKDQPVLNDLNYRLPVVVARPFGADQVVAVTSAQRMVALEQALQQLNQRRSPLQVMRMVERYAPKDARIGTVGLFTAP
jgi:uncharacterized caspase-like protein